MAPLQLFPWGDPDRLVTIAQNLVEFVVVGAALYLVGRLVVVPVVEWTLDQRAVEPTLASATEKVVRTLVVVAAVAVAAAFAGFGGLLGSSALLAAAATVALGFAAQDVIANIVSGVFIVRDRHFSIGDWIEWDGTIGVIEDISFRVTRVRTFDNEVVTVPNTNLVTSAVTNRTTEERLRISMDFGVSYDADLEEVREILLAVAEDNPLILDEPAPSVRYTTPAGDSMDLQARFWISEPGRRRYARARSDFLQGSVERCRAAGIEVGTVTDVDLSGEVGIDGAAHETGVSEPDAG